MASLKDLPFILRTFMRTYRYRTHDWTGARLSRALANSKIAVVTTAGLYPPDRPPFDASLKGGDPSWREIAADVPLGSLLAGHKSKAFDHTALDRDRNLALPLDRLRELQAEGAIGEVNSRHYSFMGSIVRPGPLVERTAPQVADRLVEDGVHAVLLTPF